MKSGGLILRNAIGVCKMSKTSWQTEKLRMNEDLGNLSKDQSYFFEHWLNMIRFQCEINQDFTNLARKYYQESFLDMHWSQKEFGKDTFWLRIWKKWKSWTHQTFISEESARKKHWYHKRRWFHFPSSRWYNQIGRKRLRIPRTHSKAGTNRKERRFQWRTSRRNGRVSEARADFWSIQGDFIDRHNNEPRVHIYVPKEETFPIPLKYIDVTRSTQTDLDVMQEKRLDDYWNVDLNRSVADSWKGFTKFTLLKDKLFQRIYVVQGEIDKSSNDYNTRSCMAWSMDQNWESRSESRKTKLEKRRAKTRQCSTTERNLS